VPDMRALPPVTAEDYARSTTIVAGRAAWELHLGSGLREIVGYLAAAGYAPATAEQRPEAAAGRGGAIGAGEVVVSGRLKETQAILAKMRRYGEPLRVMLDVWGYRVVIATEDNDRSPHGVRNQRQVTTTPRGHHTGRRGNDR